jgi:hypothetical protein
MIRQTSADIADRQAHIDVPMNVSPNSWGTNEHTKTSEKRLAKDCTTMMLPKQKEELLTSAAGN